jgi:hypothetical protein
LAAFFFLLLFFVTALLELVLFVGVLGVLFELDFFEAPLPESDFFLVTVIFDNPFVTFFMLSASGCPLQVQTNIIVATESTKMHSTHFVVDIPRDRSYAVLVCLRKTCGSQQQASGRQAKRRTGQTMTGPQIGLPSPESVSRAIESSEQKKQLLVNYLESVAHLQASIFELIGAWRSLQLDQLKDLDAHIDGLKELRQRMGSPLVIPRIGVRS